MERLNSGMKFRLRFLEKSLGKEINVPAKLITKENAARSEVGN